MSALFRRPCKHFYSLVSQVCHCRCPPFFAGDATFLPGLSLVVSALFRTQCSISIHLSPRSVTAGVRPFPPAMQALLFISLPGLSLSVSAPFSLAMQHFYSFVSQVCHCWCPPFSAGQAAFLFICFPALSLVLPPFSAGHVFYSFVSHVISFFLSFRLGACTAVFCSVRLNRFTCERFLLL